MVFLFIELAKYIAQQKLGISSPNAKPPRGDFLVALFQQIIMIQAIGPTGNASTFNGPAWSISVEFYTYFTFALITVYFSRFKQYIFAAFFFISLFLLISQNTFGFNNLFRCFTGFFLGCLVAYIKDKVHVLLPSYAPLLAFTLLVIFLAIKMNKEYDVVIFFLTALLIFSLVSSKKGLLQTVLNLKPLTLLGAISYSLYMSHSAIEWTANQIVRVILKKPEAISAGISTPVLSFSETAMAYFFVLSFVLAVSTLVFNCVEKPLRERSRRFAFEKLS